MADSTYSVTVYKQAHITTATASPNSSVAKDAEVTLSITPASGYRAVIEVISGGVTVANNKFTMGEADVVLNVKAEKANTYRVLETCVAIINGSVTKLNRNVTVVYSANGAIKDVTTGETVINDAGVVEALTKAGLIEAL